MASLALKLEASTTSSIGSGAGAGEANTIAAAWSLISAMKGQYFWYRDRLHVPPESTYLRHQTHKV